MFDSKTSGEFRKKGYKRSYETKGLLFGIVEQFFLLFFSIYFSSVPFYFISFFFVLFIFFPFQLIYLTILFNFNSFPLFSFPFLSIPFCSFLFYSVFLYVPFISFRISPKEPALKIKSIEILIIYFISNLNESIKLIQSHLQET